MHQLLSTDFMPHGYCYLWDPALVWLHVISDVFITLSYYWIPVLLVYFIRKQRNLSFNRIFWMFAVFIMACGATHFMEVWNIWHANYLLAGILKAVTAIASVVTAVALVPLMPKIISAETQLHLQEINRKLARQIAAQKALDSLTIDAPLQRTIVAGFVVAALLTAASGILSWHGQRVAAQQAEANLRNASVINVLERTIKDVLDVETGARGFALTGEDSFLEPFVAGQSSLNSDMAALHQLDPDPLRRERLNALVTLVDSSSQIASEIVASRRQSQETPGLSLFHQNKQRVDVLRAEVQTRVAERSQMLQEGTGSALGIRRTTRTVTMAASLVGICFLGLAGWATHREVRIGASARAQVWTLNTTLEQKVEERTAALHAEMQEREHSQEALRISEESFHTLANSIPQLAWMADTNGYIFWFNQRWFDYTGTVFDEMAGWGWQKVHDPRTLPRGMEEWKAAIAAGNPFEMQFPLRAADGSFHPFLTRVMPLKDAGGVVLRWFGTNTDISAQKKIESALQASLAASDRAVKELADQKFALDQHAIVAITDVQGDILYVNDKFCHISQYSRKELLGKNHRILNSGHHPKEFFQHMYRTIASGEVWHGEIKNRAKDGTFYWVDTTIVPSLNAQGKPRQYVAIRADITARKHAQQALQQQAEVLDQAQVLVRDQDDRIVLWTRGAERLYGFSRSQAVGQVSHTLLRTEFPQPPGEIARTLLRNRMWEGELAHYHRDGARLNVASIWLVQEDPDGPRRRVIEANNDITGRVRAQAILNQQAQELARSNADLEQFAYAASHDLQEPLRAVAGCLQLLQSHYPGSIDQRAGQFIFHAVDGALRMQHLINDLLEFSRVGPQGGDLQPLDLARPLAAALNNLSASIQQNQALIENAPLPAVLGDLSQLSRLFQNLIGNALKFRGSEPPHIHIGARRQQSQWVISVQDNGIGISSEYFDRIFVIFQRLHTRSQYPGTGMGLALCKKIVERHGGRIWVESELGAGTTFAFTLNDVPSPSTH